MTMRMFLSCVMALALGPTVDQGGYEPPRYESGGLSEPSPMALGGGEVLLELHVDAAGSVSKVVVLRATPPFTDPMREAAASWRFTPARDVSKETEKLVPVEAKVLVAAVFRPPTTYDAPARGEVPEELAEPSRDVAFPRQMIAPPYPPTAYWHMTQMVLLEAEVGEDGSVTTSRVIRSAPGLDAAATAALAKWKFRPARREDHAVRSFVYVVFGFREPVVSGTNGPTSLTWKTSKTPK